MATRLPGRWISFTLAHHEGRLVCVGGEYRKPIYRDRQITGVDGNQHTIQERDLVAEEAAYGPIASPRVVVGEQTKAFGYAFSEFIGLPFASTGYPANDVTVVDPIARLLVRPDRVLEYSVATSLTSVGRRVCPALALDGTGAWNL